MRMESSEFLEFVKVAMQRERDEHIRQQWVALLPSMQMGYAKYMSFEDYKAQVTGSNIDMRPTDEIIKDIEETHRKAKEKK